MKPAEISVAEMYQAVSPTTEAGADPASALVPPEVAVLANYPSGQVLRACFADVRAALDAKHRATIASIELGSANSAVRDAEGRFASVVTRAQLGRYRAEQAAAGSALREAEDAAKAATRAVVPAERVIDLRQRLGRGAAALAFLPGAIIGVSTVEGFLYVFGRGGAEINHDGSVMPGDIRSGVPGVSDIAGATVTYRTTEDNMVVVETTTTANRTDQAANPRASNWQLTGKELAQDKVTASALIGWVSAADCVIVRAAVRGEASDEASGAGSNLGVADSRNAQLARERAAVGKQAFVESLSEAGLSADMPIDVQGREVILDPAQIRTVDATAKRLGLSRSELITRYNAATLSEADQAVMEGLFPRGVDYQLTVACTERKETPTVVERIKTTDIMGMPGEAAAGLLATQLGLVTLGLTDRIRGWLARLRARSQVARAQRRAAKI
jgi:hypothetical protein